MIRAPYTTWSQVSRTAKTLLLVIYLLFVLVVLFVCCLFNTIQLVCDCFVAKLPLT